jgi:NADPH:quinone reductase-like Zn-dependent oxidoreductase
VVQGLTAHYLTASAHVNLIQPGEWFLIHGVGGGTCQWAAQMAKLQGHKVIGTISKGKDARRLARTLGCDELIVLDEVSGQSFDDYELVYVVKRVMGKKERDAKVSLMALEKVRWTFRLPPWHTGEYSSPLEMHREPFQHFPSFV